MSAVQPTPEGRLLRTATDVMDRALREGPKNRAEVEVRAAADGSILGTATWTRDAGANGRSWSFEAQVMRNLKHRGGGYASLRVTRSW